MTSADTFVKAVIPMDPALEWSPTVTVSERARPHVRASTPKHRLAAVQQRLTDEGLFARRPRNTPDVQQAPGSWTERTDHATAQFFELALSNLASGSLMLASEQFRGLEKARPDSARIAAFAQIVREGIADAGTA